jgi:glycosyltransferase involved in cell wall biosynthesis
LNISIIIRTLGRDSLTKAIASVAAQGRDDVEVIVVDASGELELPPTGGVPVRVVGNGRRLHRSVAASTGLAAVNTRWAGFLDDDDVLLPGHLDKLVTELQADLTAVLAYSGVELVSADGHEEASGSPAVIDQEFEPWQLLLANRMPIHAALFDVQRVRAAGADFDATLDLYEDWDFWLQLSLLGSFVHVPGVSARYLLHDSSGVHRIDFGDPTYWRLWRKWWTRAPQAWWTEALRAATAWLGARAELELTRADLIGKLDALHAELVGARDESWQLRREIDVHLFQIHQAREELKATHAHADNLATHLDAERATAAGLRAALDAESQLLAQARASEAALSSALAVARGDLDSRALVLTDLQRALEDSEQSLARQRQEAQRSAEQLQAILQSSSWRLTAPWRRALDRLRRLRSVVAAKRRNGAWRRLATSPARAGAYDAWMAGPEAEDRRRRLADLASLPARTVSLVMPVFNPDLASFEAAVESVFAQSYPHWELCIADDASTAPGVRERLRSLAAAEPRVRLVERPVNGHISAASNSALALARGDWVALLDQDDVLAPAALAEVVDAVSRHPQAGMVYSDEDKLDAAGHRFEPYFKPAFNIELLRGQNLISHFGAYRRSLVEEVGGFREGYEGSQDHDLALRCAERLQPSQVIHVPRVLYHWRVAAGSTAGGSERKPYAAEAGLRAVNDHLQRVAPGDVAELLPPWGFFRVRHRLPRELPRVVAWVSGSAGAAGAQDWARSLAEAAGYPGFELRWSNAPAEACLATVLHAVPQLDAPLVLMLRQGVVPQGSTWLQELVSHAVRDGVGVVGGRIDGPSGALSDGALLEDGSVAWRGTPRRSGGYFGRPVLAQAVGAVSASMMLVRREVLAAPGLSLSADDGNQASRLLCTAARQAGWRVVWTPFARASGTVAGAGRESRGPNLAAPVDDPAFNPNLCIRQDAWVANANAAPAAARPGF